MKLNLGCGPFTLAGYINIDRAGGDLLADATNLPFKEGSFDEILASHVLEHIPKLDLAMDEIRRVLQVGGVLRVLVPYGLKSLYSVSHVQAFNLGTLEAYCFRGLFTMIEKRISNYKIPLRHDWVKYLLPHLPKRLRFILDFRNGRSYTKLPLFPRSEITFVMAKLEAI